jgi:predicted SAM-dependent methyltransferase
LKYNIGAGDKPIDGYVNIDLGGDVALFNSEDADVIYTSHFLEYFDKTEVLNILKSWHFALKDGGELYISVPDFAKVVNIYQHEGIILDGALYGKMGNPYIYHKSVFDRKTLREALLLVGFKNITIFTPFHNDCSKDSISLNLLCRK